MAQLPNVEWERTKSYPEAIEATLMAPPAVADATVIVVPEPARGEAVVAFLVLRGPAGETALFAWCHERLARSK